MSNESSISRLQDYVGRRVEIVAYNISYMGVLQQFDLEKGILKLIDEEDEVFLEIERVEYFSVLK